jgi:SAM-dependent methyltransferase
LRKDNFKYCRTRFEQGKDKNLSYLIRQRYSFVKLHISKEQKGIEFGAGAGLSSVILPDYNILVTDFCDSEWLDSKNVDAQRTGLEANSFDYILMCNVIHHLDKPKAFFDEASRILKSGGKIIIIEPFSSLLMRLLIWIKKNEQINYSTYPLDDFYSLTRIAKTEDDGNNAVGRMLFEYPEKFLSTFNHLEITHKSYSECLVFINSGGQYIKYPSICLPIFMLKFLSFIDKIVITLFYRIFALGINVVVMKK